MIGLPEILVILVIILLLLGPKKLPQLARALGLATKEYKKASELSSPRPSRKRKKRVKKPAG